MRKLQSFQDFKEEHLKKHPKEIDAYMHVAFEEWAKDNDTAALLSALRVIARVKGISQMAEKTQMTRAGLQRALSPKGNPRLENVNAIMQAMGYHLMPQKNHRVGH